MKKAFSIVLIAVVCIIGIFALMNYKNANDTKENSEVDIYKTSEYRLIINNYIIPAIGNTGIKR